MNVIPLPRDRAVRTARQAASACCREAAAAPDSTDSVALMISEVVTNAVLHGRGELTLRLHCGPHVVRVEVCDEAAAWPVVSTPSFQAEGGRGMLIVDALATAWGVSPAGTGTGKAVWFEVVTQP